MGTLAADGNPCAAYYNTAVQDSRPLLKNDRLDAYLRLMRFDRPIGILLLLWPTFWALWIAGAGRPSAANIIIFFLGVVTMRAAGCVANDIADRDFDPHVERTRSRPIAAGEISVRQAALVFVALLCIALVLVLQTNGLTIALAFVGAALAASYPLFKRFTYWPQVVLGLAFGWGIPMSFAAELERVPVIAWWILLANVVWAVIYDTLYAMVDRDDDLLIGVKSTAIRFGRHDLLILRALKGVFVALLLWIGWSLQFGWPYYLAVAVAAGLLLRQQLWVRRREPAACFRAFLDNNWVGGIIFLGILTHYLMSS